MDVQNATVPAPLVPLACAPSSPVWPTYWGPKIYCTYDRSDEEVSMDPLDDNNTYDFTSETFTCNLQSANIDTLQASYRCDIVENVQHFLNNTIQNVTECIYNTSVVISNVLNPVSEISIVLPSRYEGTDSALTSSVIRNNYSNNCNVYQVLNCRSVNVNNSLYENDLIDVVNSSLMEPIKCFLAYFDDPVSFDTPDPTNVIPSSFQLDWDWTFLLVILFIVAGTVGNILVCLAVALDRKLQNVTNYFLFSLAIADLLVSLFVMPLGAIPIFLGHWPFGGIWCNVYVTCDVLACSSSIFHMCFISISRYLGIRNPLGSRHHSTKRITGFKIILVWMFAMTVSSSITILGVLNILNIMPESNKCQINNQHFFIIGSLVAFYIPMVLMMTTFYLTVRLLNRKAKFAVQHPEGEIFRRYAVRPQQQQPQKQLHQQDHQDHQVASTSSQNASESVVCHRRTSMVQSQSQQSVFCRAQGINNISERIPTIRYSKSHPHLSFSNGSSRISSRNLQTSDQCTQTPSSISRETRRYRLGTLKFNLNNVTPPNLNINLRFLNNRNKGLSENALATERKASKVLGVVFFAFAVCWTPFFVLNLIFAFCPDYEVSATVVNICLWLGYFSSTINPLIYTVFNKEFRVAFIRLLRCNFERSGRPPRYRSVNEGRGAASLCAPSALPLAISLQGAPLLTPSTVNATPMSDFRGSYTITDDEC